MFYIYGHPMEKQLVYMHDWTSFVVRRPVYIVKKQKQMLSGL